jgi:myo-inositol-1(or 4)-monophosphatase
MTYTPLIEKAIKIATAAHDGIYRAAYEYPLPYVSHLYSVASLVGSHHDDEEVIAAALLHDILEDTDYPLHKIEEHLGKRVAMLVETVTELLKKDKHLSSWRERKELYIAKLKAAGNDAAIIASADKIHNLQSALENPSKIQIKDPTQYTWFHDEVFEVIREKLGATYPLVVKHEEVLLLAKETFLPK